MDEQTWLNGADLWAMLAHLCDTAAANRTRAGRRKLRLLACAYCREVWELLSPAAREVVECVERVAEGQAGEAELRQRILAAQAGYIIQAGQMALQRADALIWAVVITTNLVQMTSSAAQQLTAIRVAQAHQAAAPAEAIRAAIDASQRRTCEIAREVFGDPFRAPARRKYPAELIGLARACQEDRSNYPLLADALADLGEDAAADHCRLPGHVRGCHVVDRLLGLGCDPRAKT